MYVALSSLIVSQVFGVHHGTRILGAARQNWRKFLLLVKIQKF